MLTREQIEEELAKYPPLMYGPEPYSCPRHRLLVKLRMEWFTIRHLESELDSATEHMKALQAELEQ